MSAHTLVPANATQHLLLGRLCRTVCAWPEMPADHGVSSHQTHPGTHGCSSPRCRAACMQVLVPARQDLDGPAGHESRVWTDCGRAAPGAPHHTAPRHTVCLPCTHTRRYLHGRRWDVAATCRAVLRPAAHRAAHASGPARCCARGCIAICVYPPTGRHMPRRSDLPCRSLLLAGCRTAGQSRAGASTNNTSCMPSLTPVPVPPCRAVPWVRMARAPSGQRARLRHKVLRSHPGALNRQGPRDLPERVPLAQEVGGGCVCVCVGGGV